MDRSSRTIISVGLQLCFYFINYVSASASPLTSTSYPNSTTTDTAGSTPTCTSPYGNSCGLIFGAEGWNWWPISYTHVVATKYVTVDGANSTSTRIEYNNASFTIPRSDYSSYSMYGTAGADILTGTAVSTLGTTLYWPTNYVALAATYTVIRNIPTTGSDGKVGCGTTTFFTSAPAVATNSDYQLVFPVDDSVATGGGGYDTEAQITPGSPILAALDLPPEWGDCAGGGGGIPVANVPVLSLTETSSIIKGGATPTPPKETPTKASPLPNTPTPPSSPSMPGSPVVNSPMPNNPPANSPSANNPPANNPPTNNPPANNPPANNPPANNPPANNPPANNPSPGGSNNPAPGGSNNPSPGGSNNPSPGGSNTPSTGGSNNASPGTPNNPSSGSSNNSPSGNSGSSSGNSGSSNNNAPDGGGSGSGSGSGNSNNPSNGNGNSNNTPGGGAGSGGGSGSNQPNVDGNRNGNGISNPSVLPVQTIAGFTFSVAPTSGPAASPNPNPNSNSPSNSNGNGGGNGNGNSGTAAGGVGGLVILGSGAGSKDATPTLLPGGPALTVSGTTISLAVTPGPSSGSSGSVLAIGGSTIPLNNPFVTPAPAAAAAAGGAGARPPITVAGGAVVTPNAASAYVFPGSAPGAPAQTLIPGGSAVTVSGTRYSLAPSGTALAVGASTIPLPAQTAEPPITVGGQTITANAQGAYVLPGSTPGAPAQTLVPGGGAVTVSGTRYSLAPSGTALVVGSSTIPLSPAAATAEPPLTVGGQTLTANAQGAYVFTGAGGVLQTLTPGGVVTITGSADGKTTVVSLGADGKTAVVGGTTEVLATAGATGAGGIGSLVWSGIGGGSAQPTGAAGANGTGTGAVQFTGGAAGRRFSFGVNPLAWTWAAGMMFMGILVCI